MANQPCDKVQKYLYIARHKCHNMSCTIYFPYCHLVGHNKYGNTMHKLEQCNYQFLFNIDKLFLFILFSLYKWFEVVRQPIKDFPLHVQNVIEHVGSIILSKYSSNQHVDLGLIYHFSSLLPMSQAGRSETCFSWRWSNVASSNSYLIVEM